MLQHGLPQSHVPASLEYVFICQDAHRGPFLPPYDGLYCALETGDKTFIVDICAKSEHVSVDHLKPAQYPYAPPAPAPVLWSHASQVIGAPTR